MPEQQPDKQVDAARASLELAFRVMAQIGGLTLAVILVAIFGGIFIDRLLDTKPLFHDHPDSREFPDFNVRHLPCGAWRRGHDQARAQPPARPEGDAQ